MKISFTVWGKPKPWKRPFENRRRQEFSKRSGTLYHPTINPSKADEDVFAGKSFMFKPPKPFHVPVRLDVVFCFQRPKSHYGSWNKQPYLKPGMPLFVGQKKRNDIDNHLKLVLDALNGIFWEDDGYIASVHMDKLYTEKLPRTDVTIQTLIGKEFYVGEIQNTNEGAGQSNHPEKERTPTLFFSDENCRRGC